MKILKIFSNFTYCYEYLTLLISCLQDIWYEIVRVYGLDTKVQLQYCTGFQIFAKYWNTTESNIKISQVTKQQLYTKNRQYIVNE